MGVRDSRALTIHLDEDAVVYVNGRKVVELSGYTTGYEQVDVTTALRDALRAGSNVLAVHCRQTTGGPYIDVGILFGSATK